MKNPLHSTLHALFAARAPKAGEQAPGNWIAAFLEALYELQRHQALGVIRAYQGLLAPPNDGTEHVDAAPEDREDATR